MIATLLVFLIDSAKRLVEVASMRKLILDIAKVVDEFFPRLVDDECLL